MLVIGTCSALSEIGRSGTLPLPNDSPDKDKVTKLSLVTDLMEKVQCQKDGFNPKVLRYAYGCNCNLLDLVCIFMVPL